MFQVENYNTSVMTLVHFFKFLLTTCSLIWMLNHSSFLQSKFLLRITLRARTALLLGLLVDEILDQVFWMMCSPKSSAKKPDTITRTVSAFFPQMWNKSHRHNENFTFFSFSWVVVPLFCN